MHVDHKTKGRKKWVGVQKTKGDDKKDTTQAGRVSLMLRYKSPKEKECLFSNTSTKTEGGKTAKRGPNKGPVSNLKKDRYPMPKFTKTSITSKKICRKEKGNQGKENRGLGPVNSKGSD